VKALQDTIQALIQKINKRVKRLGALDPMSFDCQERLQLWLKQKAILMTAFNYAREGRFGLINGNAISHIEDALSAPRSL
jgi:hypothetical protein